MFQTEEDKRQGALSRARFGRKPKRGVTSPAIDDVLAEKFQLVRQIGEGGMGTVYEAVHVITNRRFAVKILHPIHLQVDEMRWRFQREAAVAGSVEHENVVSILDFGYAAGGAPYIVMEYLAGESLFECLQREGPLPITRAVDIAIQACRGLAAAHVLGIVHRDVKPENLFLCKHSDGSDLVKVLDFGIAKVSSELGRAPTSLRGTDADCIMGTPDYMCPEQAHAPAAVDHRADIYGLGAVLFEALSGERPHPEKSFGAIIDHLLTKAPEPVNVLRPTLPSGLAEIVHRALAFDAGDRFPSARDFAAALLPYGNNQASSGTRGRSGTGGVVASFVSSAPTVRLPRHEVVAFPRALAEADPGKAVSRVFRRSRLTGLAAVATIACLLSTFVRPRAHAFRQKMHVSTTAA